MNIAGLSRLVATLQIGAILVGGLVVVDSSRRVDRELALEEAAHEVNAAAVSLRYLTMEYAMSQRERSRVQWHLRHASLSALLEGAALEPAAISRLQQHGRIFAVLFNEFEVSVRSGDSGPAGVARAERRSRLMGQLLNRAEIMRGDAGELAAQSRARVAEVRRRANWIGGILLVLVLSLVAMAQWLLRRSVIVPLLALREHTAQVGAGNLALRLGLRRQDELGQLARAFDDMASGLERSTVSRDELVEANRALEGEVQERVAAERKAQARVQGLRLLQQITRAIGERQDARSIFQVVVASLEEALPADFACIALLDPASNELVVWNLGAATAPLGRGVDLGEQARIPVAESAGLTKCMQGRLVYKPDVASAQCPLATRLGRGGLRSLVVAPMTVEAKVLGAVVAARWGADAFTSDECEFLLQLGELVGLAAHQAEMHEALRLAYEQARQNQQAVLRQERLRALGQMASGIAHDINNAISPVALYAEALATREPGLSERGREQLAIIRRSVDDVAETVGRMREFYRQREGMPELGAVALNEVVTQVIQLTTPRWSDMPLGRGIVIRAVPDLEPGLPPVRAVASELREALTNLVFNAVDAMPQGGDIVVRTRLQPALAGDGEEPVAAHVMLEVADTGVGMDEKTRQRCMEPFFTTKGERGSGLGLAMVYGVAQRHGAGVEIESVPGRGTTVRLRFPLSAAAPAQGTESGPMPLELASLSVLSIDDDAVLLASLAGALEADGHRVTVAEGGHAGIEAFRAAAEKGSCFDVVITDLGMPHVTGREVAAAIKRMSPATPVILLTGWGQLMTADAKVIPHVDGVLPKPPRRRDVRAMLERLCTGEP